MNRLLNAKRFCLQGSFSDSTMDTTKAAAVGAVGGAIRGTVKCTPAAVGGPFSYGTCIAKEALVGATIASGMNAAKNGLNAQ